MDRARWIQETGRLFPEAVTQWDASGNAISLDWEKLRLAVESREPEREG